MSSLQFPCLPSESKKLYDSLKTGDPQLLRFLGFPDNRTIGKTTLNEAAPTLWCKSLSSGNAALANFLGHAHNFFSIMLIITTSLMSSLQFPCLPSESKKLCGLLNTVKASVVLGYPMFNFAKCKWIGVQWVWDGLWFHFRLPVWSRNFFPKLKPFFFKFFSFFPTSWDSTSS